MNPTLTFDANQLGTRCLRVFWAAICEEIGQNVVIVPTARTEALHRIHLEADFEWCRKLRSINATERHGWTRSQLKDLATIAADTAHSAFRTASREKGSVYAKTPPPDTATIELETEIELAIDDNAFNFAGNNGIFDRKILIETMARGLDIVMTNNPLSVIQPILTDWIERREGRELGITTVILDPEAAETALRRRHDKDPDWTAIAIARACVTDPDDPKKAAADIHAIIDTFDRRRMGQIKETILSLTATEKAFDAVLDQVRRHGTNRTLRAEREQLHAITRALSHHAGVTISP